MSKESMYRVSAAQTSVLCKFFEENPGLIRGYKKTVKNRIIVQRKWKRITEKLNSCGPSRSQKSWATYLSNLKAKLKGQSVIWQQSGDGTDPVICNADKFSEIQIRILQVLHKNLPERNSDEPQDSQSESETSDSSDVDSDSDNDMIILENNSKDIEPEVNIPGHIKLEQNVDGSHNYGNAGSDSRPELSIKPYGMSKEVKFRISAAQTKILATFFEKNPEVVKGYKKTAKSKKQVQNKWKTITEKLNAYGPSRDYRSWSKYLCNMKAKLKGHTIKWRQSSNGTGPIICNADDFTEIQLRMLHVLRRDASNSQEAENSASPSDTGDINDDDIDTDNDIVILNKNNQDFESGMDIPDHIELEQTEPQTSEIFVDDEFASFGKNVAQQLRTLPLPVALETQEKLLSVLRDQRIKLLIGSTRSLDPLEKSLVI